MPQDYWQLCFEVPEADVTALEPLPPGWDDPPPYHDTVQAVGDAWVKAGASLALAVPSALLPTRRNLLINPRHPGIARVREVERAPLRWPAALVGRLERRGEM
jgi:RES domain-containing protein